VVDDPSTLINYWLSVWELHSFYARQPEQGEGQRVWAETAMYALGRAEAAGLDTTSANASRFYLRAGLISDLGPMGSLISVEPRRTRRGHPGGPPSATGASHRVGHQLATAAPDRDPGPPPVQEPAGASPVHPGLFVDDADGEKA
jgi:hypothetical protein